MVEILINGRKVRAKDGDTVLKAAQKAGIYIPTLCHNDSVKPYSACRMCMVEISNPKHPGWKKLVASCVTQ